MKRRSTNLFLTTFLFFSFLLTGTYSFAGKHWLSGSRIYSQEISSGPYDSSLSSTSSISVLDLVVSLHKTPSSQAERDRYRKVLEYFADAVYEATEGKLRIGNIYIYTDYRFASKADILWRNSGWPNSYISAYDKLEGQHLNMFDEFPGVFDITRDDDKEYRKAGYTLAHELGHYVFGLYDEYKVAKDDNWNECKAKWGEDLCQHIPRSDDKSVAPSIMNNQFCSVALEGYECLLHPLTSKTPKWLNYSIKLNSDFGDDFEIKEQTAQYRLHKKSAWETLTSDPANDDKKLWLNNSPSRMQFLSLIAPKNEPTIQLPNTNSKSKFNVLWMTDKLVYQIVLDKSPSMDFLDIDGTARIVKAKAAAKQLVEAAEISKTAIGIVAFCNYASVVYPITDIYDSNTKLNIQKAIDTITTCNATSVYDGAKKAMDNLLLRAPTETRVVFLLTDGASNSDVYFKTPEQVISYYKQYSVPLFTFGYGNAGSDINADILNKLASETGGKFYLSPTTFNEIVLAFNDAKKFVNSELTINTTEGDLMPCGSSGKSELVFEYTIDSSLTRAINTVIFPNILQQVDDLQIKALNPNGIEIEVSNPSCSNYEGKNTICNFFIDLTKYGMSGVWKTVLSSKSCKKYEHIKLDLGAVSEKNIPCTLSAINLTGPSVQYPAPILISAILSKDLPIAGADVTGVLEFPDGTTTHLFFRDDGLPPDHIANDGNYAAILTEYKLNGTYKIGVKANNRSKNAYLTYNQAMMSIDLNGNLPSSAPDTPLREDLERMNAFQITMQGVVEDDHGNNFETATTINADNKDHFGKIDTEGDLDFFKIDLSNSSVSDIIFRVTGLSPGMIPVLKLYDGEQQFVRGKTYLSGNNYIAIIEKTNNNSVYFVAVGFSGDNGTGTYNLSAGPKITTDNDYRLFFPILQH